MWDEYKLNLLKQANNILNITKSKLNKIIFVYSYPKVGSTSIISTLRIFASHIYNIIHIHDENMLKVLGNINNVSVIEIIEYNKFLGKDIFVIDIYRLPIERKISCFFEKIDTYHFNTNIENLNTYSIERIFERFNKIFPFIGNGDKYYDEYNLLLPEKFDFINKYLLIEKNGIKYIKLRLNDSHLWNNILSKLLSVDLKIVKDYETNKKKVKDIYTNFISNYKLPNNFLYILNLCKYFNYYNSPEEINTYLNNWKNKLTNIFQNFNQAEFCIYKYICESNNNQYYIQNNKNHYIDEGCICKACSIKRNNIKNKLLIGETKIDAIIHDEAKNELINNRLEKINTIRKNLPKKKKMTMINFPARG